MSPSAGSRDGFLLMSEVESSRHLVRRVCEAQKHPKNPALPFGDLHEWDGGLLAILDKPAIKDETIHLFYWGNGDESTSWPAENTPDDRVHRQCGGHAPEPKLGGCRSAGRDSVGASGAVSPGRLSRSVH